MPDIGRALERLSGRGPERGASAVFERASHGPLVRERSLVPAAVAGAAVVMAVLLGALALQPADRDHDVTTEVPPTSPVFDATTETVLLFDDGYDGIVVLDLDTGAVRRRTIEGQRAGDQPFRLHRAGTRLVVGWGEVWSTTLDEGPSTRIAETTVFVPAAEDDSVWVVSYPGGRIGSGAPTVKRIGVVDGVVLEDLGEQPEGTLLLREVPGGLAYEAADGIEVRGRDGVVSRSLTGTIGDATASHLAWCAASPCHGVELLDASTESLRTIEPRDDGYAVNPAAMRFSPDGARLAVQTGPEVLIVDTASGEVDLAIEDALPDGGSLAWSDDGSQLFYASPGVVGRVEVATGGHERRAVDLGQAFSFVAVPRSTVPAMLGEPVIDDVVENLRTGQLDRVAFAEPVHLLLGREAWSGLGAPDVRQPHAWSIDAGLFNGYSGSFSALRTLAATDEITVEDGPVAHCAAPALPDPTDFEYDTHLVARPALADDASCLEWFAVEVFLRDGKVVAVSLDLWEP